MILYQLCLYHHQTDVNFNEAKSCYNPMKQEEHTIKSKATIKRYYQEKHPY